MNPKFNIQFLESKVGAFSDVQAHEERCKRLLGSTFKNIGTQRFPIVSCKPLPGSIPAPETEEKRLYLMGLIFVRECLLAMLLERFNMMRNHCIALQGSNGNERMGLFDIPCISDILEMELEMDDEGQLFILYNSIPDESTPDSTRRARLGNFISCYGEFVDNFDLSSYTPVASRVHTASGNCIAHIIPNYSSVGATDAIHSLEETCSFMTMSSWLVSRSLSLRKGNFTHPLPLRQKLWAQTPTLSNELLSQFRVAISDEMEAFITEEANKELESESISGVHPKIECLQYAAFRFSAELARLLEADAPQPFTNPTPLDLFTHGQCMLVIDPLDVMDRYCQYGSTKHGGIRIGYTIPEVDERATFCVINAAQKNSDFVKSISMGASSTGNYYVSEGNRSHLEVPVSKMHQSILPLILRNGKVERYIQGAASNKFEASSVGNSRFGRAISARLEKSSKGSEAARSRSPRLDRTPTGKKKN